MTLLAIKTIIAEQAEFKLMRIATWNINSVKAHFEVLKRWLEEAKPDVLCLQEIKCETPAFPAVLFEALGYHCYVKGQKSYNGVALLSRHHLEDVITELPGTAGDEQARYIQGTLITPTRALTIASLYLPNGNPVDSPKFSYKLAWMNHLTAHAANLLKREEPLILAGDYNIIPQDIDARYPEQWRGDALFRPESRSRFHTLLGLGLTEAFRALHPNAEGQYSFFDYQAGAWQKQNGIRIDHLLLSPQAADLLESAQIDPHVRGWDKPSDHVPVVIDLAA